RVRFVDTAAIRTPPFAFLGRGDEEAVCPQVKTMATVRGRDVLTGPEVSVRGHYCRVRRSRRGPRPKPHHNCDNEEAGNDRGGAHWPLMSAHPRPESVPWWVTRLVRDLAKPGGQPLYVAVEVVVGPNLRRTNSDDVLQRLRNLVRLGHVSVEHQD